MVKRVKLLLTLCILICCTLTACFDAQEVDDEVYALALGIDKGMTNKIRLTIQYPTYKAGGGGGAEQEKNKGGMGNSNETSGSNIHTIEAPSILEALDMYGMAISRRVSLMHMKNLIIAEDIAREGIQDHLAPMSRFRETRRIVDIAVVRGTAQKYIQENKANIGESLSKSMELMAVQSQNTSYFPKVTFHDFYRGLLSTYDQSYVAYTGINEFKELPEEQENRKAPLVIDNGFIPGKLPRSGVAKREFVGTAVFSADRMTGYLNSEETRYFLMIIGKFKKAIINIPDEKIPDKVIPLDFRLSRKPVMKGHFKNGEPVIDLKLELEADIGSIQSRINYENKNNIEKLNTDTELYIRERVIRVITKVKNEYKSDIFGFGQKFAGYFPTIQEWERYDWLKHFPEARVNIEVSVNIRRTGTMINSSKVRGKNLLKNT